MKSLPAFLLVSILAGFALTSCETGPASSKPSVGTAAAATGSVAPDGRKIYYGRCTSCHAADPVSNFSRSEWHRIIAEMAPKAKLSGAERSAVMSYVLAHAADS